MLFMRSNESWSETSFDSAKRSPTPPPSPPHLQPLELWILPWGKQRLLVSLELRPPQTCSRMPTRITEEELIEELSCDPLLFYLVRML